MTATQNTEVVRKIITDAITGYTGEKRHGRLRIACDAAQDADLPHVAEAIKFMMEEGIVATFMLHEDDLTPDQWRKVSSLSGNVWTAPSGKEVCQFKDETAKIFAVAEIFRQ